MLQSTIRAGVVGAVVAIAIAPARAGDINPPAGAVMPTDRQTINPQTATFPIQINQSGSYVLLGDLTVGAVVNAINIFASNVTIDLNGFTIDGTGVGLEGITGVAGLSNVTIRNGTVQRFQGGGVYLISTTNCVVENVRSVNNSLEGIVVGAGSRVSDCFMAGNQTGAYLSPHSVLENCLVDESSILGVFLDTDATVRDCRISRTADTAISIGRRCVVMNNAVTKAGAGGAGSVGILQRNDGVGRSRIDSNHITGYVPAIRVDPAMSFGEVLIVRNSVFDAGGAGGAGYEPNGNLMPVGLSTDPDTADAWDNFWWVTVFRGEEDAGADSAPSPLDPALAPEAFDPRSVPRPSGR